MRDRYQNASETNSSFKLNLPEKEGKINQKPLPETEVVNNEFSEKELHTLEDKKVEVSQRIHSTKKIHSHQQNKSQNNIKNIQTFTNENTSEIQKQKQNYLNGNIHIYRAKVIFWRLVSMNIFIYSTVPNVIVLQASVLGEIPWFLGFVLFIACIPLNIFLCRIGISLWKKHKYY